jgi:hypothetical protein
VSDRSTMAGSRRVGGAGVYEASYSLLHTGHMHLRASAAELPPLSSDCHRRRHVRWTNLWSPLHSHGDTSSPCELPSKQKRQSASSSESASSCEDIREGGRKQVETNQLFVCEQTTNKSSDTQSNHIHYNVLACGGGGLPQRRPPDGLPRERSLPSNVGGRVPPPRTRVIIM